MQYFPIFLLILVVLILVARPLTVLFHELGHAIPAMLLTKQKVTIYIGSYGEPKRSIKINIGLLTIFFRYNPLAWMMGLCVPSATSISINRQIIYTLTGPITSILIATIACYYTFAYDLHGFLKLFLIIFLLSSFWDLVINLVPDRTPIRLFDGTFTYNDGFSLRRLFSYKRFPKQFSIATELYEGKNYTEAAVEFERLIPDTQDEDLYRYAISSYLQVRNHLKVKELSDNFEATGKMNSNDLSNMALTYSHLSLHDDSLRLYDRSLALDPTNKYSLNNKGYTLNLLNRFQEAITYFDDAIEADKDFAYSYNNRGLAKIKLGKTDDGLQDINYSFTLDPDNSYGYMNLGIYHFDKGEFEQALRLFEKAKELDHTTHMIDHRIKEAKCNLT